VTVTQATEWAEVFVSEIRRTHYEGPRQRRHVMILAERGGDRRLPIWIGPAEATVLALTLESVETPRPFRYELAAGLVEAAGSQIVKVKITRLLGSVVYARVIVQGPGGPREVDARPSDAVNLAAACGAPIMLNSELFSATPAASYAGRRATPRAPGSVAGDLPAVDVEDLAGDVRRRLQEQDAVDHVADLAGVPERGSWSPSSA